MGGVLSRSAAPSAAPEEVKRVIEAIRQTTGASSVSYGAVKDGKLAANGGHGGMDMTDPKSRAPDLDSIYTCASVSKVFVGLLVALLVADGKMSMDEPIATYVPEFCPKTCPDLGAKSTLKDLLCHSGGLDNPVVSILGPKGKVLVQAGSFMDVLNNTPTAVGGCQWKGNWCYSNVSYALVALAIERVSGSRLADLLKERILEPLGMKHTIVSKSSLEEKRANVVIPCNQLDDQTWRQMDHEWTDDENTPFLAMFGIRTSVSDLLLLGTAIMDAINHADGQTGGQQCQPAPKLKTLEKPESNPLRHASASFKREDWNFPKGRREVYDDEVRYHAGLARVDLPSYHGIWGSWISTSGPDKTIDAAHSEKSPTFKQAVLGLDSGPRVLFKASGISFCGTISMNLFPETMSAVVVCSSGLNCGDASGFVGLHLMQWLFHLTPEIDVHQWAQNEADARQREFDQVQADLDAHRDTSTPEAPLNDYVGVYTGFGISLTVEKTESGVLTLCFNGRKEIMQTLEYFAKDQYHYWPKSRDEWLADGWLDWDHYLVGILKFERDETTAEVKRATWVWEKGAAPHPFEKVLM